MPKTAKAIEFAVICPVLVCADLGKSLAFFTKKLGFKTELSYPESKPIFASVCRGNCSVHLAATGKRPTSNKKAWAPGNKPADIDFFVSDVDRLYKEFRRRGVRIEHKPTTWPYGIRDIDVLTPDGQVLRFNQVLHAEKK